MRDDEIMIDALISGDLIRIENYLDDECDEIFVDHLYHIGNNKLSLLMGGCFYQNANLVRLLLLKYRSRLAIDLLGTIQFDSSSIHPEIAHDVPALWIATAMNDLNLVQLLIEIGQANVNHMTISHSTAFRVACFNGNLELCRYLVSKGANVNQSRIGNHTNLMISTFWKHLHIVKYLIEEMNVNPNEETEFGRTALHNAVQSHSIEIIQYLLEKKVQLIKDKQTNLTPLLLAIENNQLDLIDLFENHCSISQWIEGKEFLGAIYSSQCYSNYNFNKAYQYFSQSLYLRIQYYLPKMISNNLQTIFPNEEEYQTLEQLNSIIENPDQCHIQSLLILERILGLNNQHFNYSLRYYAASLIDFNQFQQGLNIWIYQINRSWKCSPHDDYKHIFRTFIHLFIKIKLNHQIKEYFFQPFFQIIYFIDQQIQNQDQNTNFNLHTLLYLFTILAMILEEEIFSWKNYPDFYQLIKSIVQSNDLITTDTNSTLLHLSVNSETEEYYICKYPCLKTISFLIQFGISIDQMDYQRNTSLHILIEKNENSLEIYQLIDLLCEFGGAHLDCVNTNNQIPMKLTRNIQIEKYLQQKKRIFNLKCLCATFIQIKQISFQTILNKSLRIFLNKH